jgi:hypothetical protein
MNQAARVIQPVGRARPLATTRQMPYYELQHPYQTEWVAPARAGLAVIEPDGLHRLDEADYCYEVAAAAAYDDDADDPLLATRLRPVPQPPPAPPASHASVYSVAASLESLELAAGPYQGEDRAGSIERLPITGRVLDGHELNGAGHLGGGASDFLRCPTAAAAGRRANQAAPIWPADPYLRHASWAGPTATANDNNNNAGVSNNDNNIINININNSNNNNGLKNEIISELDCSINNNAERDCLLGTKYEWPDGIRPTSVSSLTTSSGRLGAAANHRLGQLAPAAAAIDRRQVDFVQPFACLYHDPLQAGPVVGGPGGARPAAAGQPPRGGGPFASNDSNGGAFRLSPSATKRLNCPLLECCQQQQFEATQIAIDSQDNAGSGKLRLSSSQRNHGPPSHFCSTEPNEANNDNNNNRHHSTRASHSSLSIWAGGGPAHQAPSKMTGAAASNGPAAAHALAAALGEPQFHERRLYTPPPSPPLSTTNELTAMMSRRDRHQLCPSIDDSAQCRRPPPLALHSSTTDPHRQPYQAVGQSYQQPMPGQLQPAGHRVASSLPSSPVVLAGGGGQQRAQPYHYGAAGHAQSIRSGRQRPGHREHCPALGGEPLDREGHLSRWPPAGANNGRPALENGAPEEPPAGWSWCGDVRPPGPQAAAGVAAAAADSCRQRIVIGQPPPAPSAASCEFNDFGKQIGADAVGWHEPRDSNNNKDDEWSATETETEATAEDGEESEPETLALVPSQAKGRLPMSVAEQVSSHHGGLRGRPSGAGRPSGCPPSYSSFES